MYSWVAQPHTSGSHSKHTFSNAQGDTPSEGGFDALPSTWETPESIDCTTARRRTVQAAAPRGLAEDCMQNALTMRACVGRSRRGQVIFYALGMTRLTKTFVRRSSVSAQSHVRQI